MLDIIALCLQIRQRDSGVTEPAILNVGLIVVVVDFAIGVEILLVIERIELGIVNFGA